MSERGSDETHDVWRWRCLAEQTEHWAQMDEDGEGPTSCSEFSKTEDRTTAEMSQVLRDGSDEESG